MTTLVALHDPELGTFVGAESQATAGYLRAGSGVLKWVIHSTGWAAAAAGPLGAIGLMRDSADLLFKNLKSPMQFGERLKGVLHKGGFVPMAEEAGPAHWGLQIVLAGPTGVWDFDTTLTSHQIDPGVLWAAGSGKEFALGAGVALQGLQMLPQERLARALNASIAYDTMSGGQVHIMQLVAEPIPARSRAKPAAKKPAPKKAPGKTRKR